MRCDLLDGNLYPLPQSDEDEQDDDENDGEDDNECQPGVLQLQDLVEVVRGEIDIKNGLVRLFHVHVVQNPLVPVHTVGQGAASKKEQQEYA